MVDVTECYGFMHKMNNSSFKWKNILHIRLMLPICFGIQARAFTELFLVRCKVHTQHNEHYNKSKAQQQQ